MDEKNWAGPCLLLTF